MAASNDHGITPCPLAALSDLSSPHALECWFDAPHGRWRMLSQIEVHGALVVHAEAADIRDARFIAERFLQHQTIDFSEMAVYVRREWQASPTTRRVQWRRGKGFGTLDFTRRAYRSDGPAEAGPHE